MRVCLDLKDLQSGEFKNYECYDNVFYCTHQGVGTLRFSASLALPLFPVTAAPLFHPPVTKGLALARPFARSSIRVWLGCPFFENKNKGDSIEICVKSKYLVSNFLSTEMVPILNVP